LQVVAASRIERTGMPFDENDTPAKGRQAGSQRRPGNTATDDQDIGRQSLVGSRWAH